MAMANEFRVMTSGAFTAAYLALVPQLERLAKKKVVAASTSIGTGENSIPNRLKRGEIVDIVIVAEHVLRQFVQDGLVLADGMTVLARSSVAVAVRAGAPKPDIGSAAALEQALLRVGSIAISTSASGVYLRGLFQRLGIADALAPKLKVAEGEPAGKLVARGEAEIGFQQMSELLPVRGIDIVGPLPPEIQETTLFSAGIATAAQNADAARALVQFLTAPAAAAVIRRHGMEPA